MTDTHTASLDPEAIETPAEASLHRAWLADLAEQAEERDRRGSVREWKPTRTVMHGGLG